MSFEKQKKDFLIKKDKSKKAKIDSIIKKLINLINSLPNYYTTSSCSGRIVLLEKKSDKKQDSKWLFVKHDKVDFREIYKVIKKIIKKNKYDIWFREEPLILHVCCKSLQDAKNLLNIARGIFKRTGIITINKKIIVEVIGTEFIDTLIIRDNKLLIEKDYLDVLVKEANKKLMKNYRHLKELYYRIKFIENKN
jgi:tRNA wybutosine-synthesizing protein 3